MPAEPARRSEDARRQATKRLLNTIARSLFKRYGDEKPLALKHSRGG
jgi:hypothetical protein